MTGTTATPGKPNGQRSVERSTTLLNLLLDLSVHCDGSEESLVDLAVDEITTGNAVLSGNYRGIDPLQFESARYAPATL